MIPLIILGLLVLLVIYGLIDAFIQISKIPDEPKSKGGSYDDLLKYRRGKSKY